MEYLVLTEVTLPRLLCRALFRQPTCLVGTWSFLSGIEGGALGRIAGWLRARGRLTDLDHDHSDAMTYDNDVHLMMKEDVFAVNELALERIFEFSGSDARFGRYSLAYRHAVCGRAIWRLRLIHRIYDICRIAAPDRDRIAGLEPEETDLYRARFGEVPSLPSGRGGRMRSIMGIIIAGLSIARGLLWIATAIRLRHTAANSFLLGSDFCNDGRDIQLWREITEDPSQIMAVFRNSELAREGIEMVPDHPSCLRTDGWFAPLVGLQAMTELVADTFRLFRRGHSLPSDIFRALAVLPFKRMIFRGLFNRYRFRFFWDRSDYNTEHVMCSQELRAAGGRSLGLMHGIPSICSVTHQLRHLDYDLYYCMSRLQYLTRYREKWPDHMQVRIIGTFGLTRAEHHLLAQPRPSDMVFYVVETTQGMAGLELVDLVAATFPERRIYVNTKKHSESGTYEAAMDALASRHPNVVIHWGRSYDLLFVCSYAFSEGSTLAAEAAQAGLYSFTLDLVPEQWKVNFYREFPGMCLHNAAEVIDRIRAIESGAWAYPRHLYGEMIGMSGRVFYDIVREDLGLPSKEAALSHLAFLPGES